MMRTHSSSVKLKVMSFVFLANAILLRHCLDRNHRRLKSFLGKTVFVGEPWGLIKANLLNNSKRNHYKKHLWKIYIIFEISETHFIFTQIVLILSILSRSRPFFSKDVQSMQKK